MRSNEINRRDFVKTTAVAGLCLAAGASPARAAEQSKSQVFLVKPSTRAEGVNMLLEMFGRASWNEALRGKKVILKPNFNSAHDFPGSSHPDTLLAICGEIHAAEPASITIADRSGMGKAAEVMEKTGCAALAEKFGVVLVPFEDLKPADIVKRDLPGSHWSKGIEWPKLYEDADCIINTCCLKTHQYGGHFTLSMKNSVGMISRYGVDEDKHDFMRELHRSPDQRRMIAEINTLYSPALVIMDALACFIDGGPHEGTLKEPGVMLASTDRVAIDAAGVAILRHYGTTPEVGEGPVFELDQIKRAVELGLGAASPDLIEIIAADQAAEEFAGIIRAQLARG